MTVGNFIRYARTQAVTTKSDAFALTAKQDVGCTPARFLRQAPALSRPLEHRRFLRRKETHHVYHHHDVAICEVFPAQAFDHPASVDRLLCPGVCRSMACPASITSRHAWLWPGSTHLPRCHVF